MNYNLLNELNRYIEIKNKEYGITKNHFVTIATPDFCNMSFEELMASKEVFEYIDEPHINLTNVSVFREFKGFFENGMIDICSLTSRQKMLFITCLNDHECTQKMIIAGKECEEALLDLRKALPAAVCVLKDPASFSQEQINNSREIAMYFIDCNQRVHNYRTYLDFAKMHE